MDASRCQRLSRALFAPIASAVLLAGCEREAPSPPAPLPTAGATSAPATAPGTGRATGPTGASPAGQTAAGPAAPAPAAGSGRAPARIVFTEEAAARGLDYVNRSGEAAKRTILEANGAGVALLDLGRDGDLDVVFSQGLASLAELNRGPGADLEVFENDGSGRFQRIPGPGLSGWWTGLATGDLDGDGDDDLIAGGYGGLVALLQGENGRLAAGPGSDLIDPAAAARGAKLVPGASREGASELPAWTTSLALADFDRDGALDLYVCRYVGLDPLAPPLGSVGEGALGVPCRWKGHEVFCGPHGMPKQEDRLLFGRGDGTFEDRTAASLGGLRAGYALGVAAFDADGDGDTDVYVAHDSVANVLWINDGRGRFQDFAYTANVALSMDGAPEAGMGVAFGDIDGDGSFDFALTNFSGEPTELFFGAAKGFENRTHRLGLARETLPLLSWSVHLFDADDDGTLELFTTNGHVYPQADEPGTGTRYGQAPTMWRVPRPRRDAGDTGAGRADPSGKTGRVQRIGPTGADSLFSQEVGARGSAIGDLDGDGDLDLVVARIDAPAALGVNRTDGSGARLLVRCLGPRARSERAPRTPSDGHGTRVRLELAPGSAASTARIAEVQTAQGYQSASTPWLHFGLGERLEYAELEIVWPSGAREKLGPGRANRRIVVREGEGVIASEDLP